MRPGPSHAYGYGPSYDTRPRPNNNKLASKEGRLNKNITCFDGADPASVSSRPRTVRLSVAFAPVSRFRSGVEWTGDRVASTWSPRRARRLIAHLLRAGRWAEPVPSPAADWSRLEARGKTIIIACQFLTRVFTPIQGSIERAS